MSKREPAHALAQVSQKWRDLAERAVPCSSSSTTAGAGSIISEGQFLHRMRDAIRAADTWACSRPGPSQTAPTDGRTRPQGQRRARRHELTGLSFTPYGALAGISLLAAAADHSLCCHLPPDVPPTIPV